MTKSRAPRNRTIVLEGQERSFYAESLIKIVRPVQYNTILDKIVNQDVIKTISFLPDNLVDLLILDPPYNITKSFNSSTFRKKSISQYAQWFEELLTALLPKLNSTASVYVCSEWYSSTAIHFVLDKFLKVRNRITWQREKGRGAKSNYKNVSEDIWFATVSNDYIFNAEEIKLKRKVIAPYTNSKGEPKDWQTTSAGKFRLTYPSNFWNDITVPFWSMPENTIHPTQKPEKLLAKLVLASTNKGDFVFDPFMGVGSSVVTAKKLNRRFLGIEKELEYCLLAAKRLHLAELDKSIQGYDDNVFWERNTLNMQKREKSVVENPA